ncbi:MAG: tetratricopeptide repeat protein [Armatimonadota bacterium]
MPRSDAGLIRHGTCGRALLVLAGLFALVTLCGCGATNAWMKADGLFKAQKFDEAAQAYADAAKHNPGRHELLFNRGVAQYMAGDIEGAMQSFEKVAKQASSELKEKAEFNIGNSYVAKKEREKALQQYRRTLYLNSDNMRAKWNLEMLQRQQQDQQPQQDDQKEKKEDQKDQEDQKQKKDTEQDQQEKQKQQQDEEQQQEQQADEKQKNQQQKRDETPQERPRELSKEQAERLLQALSEQDKELQESLRKPRYKVKPAPGDRDW